MSLHNPALPKSSFDSHYLSAYPNTFTSHIEKCKDHFNLFSPVTLDLKGLTLVGFFFGGGGLRNVVDQNLKTVILH